MDSVLIPYPPLRVFLYITITIFCFYLKTETPREEEDRAGLEVSEGNRRLHLFRKDRASQDQGRTYHPRRLLGRGHGNTRDVLRPSFGKVRLPNINW